MILKNQRKNRGPRIGLIRRSYTVAVSRSNGQMTPLETLGPDHVYFLLLLQKKVAKKSRAVPIAIGIDAEAAFGRHFSCQNRRLGALVHRTLCIE